MGDARSTHLAIRPGHCNLMSMGIHHLSQRCDCAKLPVHVDMSDWRSIRRMSYECRHFSFLIDLYAFYLFGRNPLSREITVGKPMQRK